MDSNGVQYSMNLTDKLLRRFRGFECAMCGFKTRLQSRIDRHVKEFPNCAFTEQSYQYLSTLSQSGKLEDKP